MTTQSRDTTGIEFGRYLAAVAAGAGNLDRAAKFAKGAGWTGIAAAMSSAALEDGGAWVPQNYIPEMIELLRPASAVRSLNPRIVDLKGGTATFPKLAQGSTAYYVGEGKAATKSQGKSAAVTLVGKKLIVFIPVSNDLVRRSNPSAGLLMRDDAVVAIGERSDLAFIRGDGTEDTPRGLRYLAASANIIPANATVNLANVTEDLGKARLALVNANVPMRRPGWIMSPRTEHYLRTVRDTNGNFAFREEMLSGRLDSYPFAPTTQVPTNLGVGSNESELYLADFADVLLGEVEGLRVDAFTQGSYWDGAEWQSAAANDVTLVRIIGEHDLGVRHAESVAVLTGVKWGA